MAEHQLDKTRSRSVVGVMNDFTHLAAAYAEQGGADDLDGLSR